METGSVDKEVLVTWAKAVFLYEALRNKNRGSSLRYVLAEAKANQNEWTIDKAFFEEIDRKVDRTVNNWIEPFGNRPSLSYSCEDLTDVIPQVVDDMRDAYASKTAPTTGAE